MLIRELQLRSEIQSMQETMDRWVVLAERWEAMAYRWRDTANRWRRYAYITGAWLVTLFVLLVSLVVTTPVRVPVMFARTMTVQVIHCPSEDGGVPHCVWDTWTDGNGRGDPDGPRWLVWP